MVHYEINRDIFMIQCSKKVQDSLFKDPVLFYVRSISSNRLLHKRNRSLFNNRFYGRTFHLYNLF